MSEPDIRCDITDNPVGTDTWRIGAECDCYSCKIGRAFDAIKAELAAEKEAREKAEKNFAQEEQAHLHSLEQRDNAEKWADDLSLAIGNIAGTDVGEHSNMNDPWRNAFELTSSISANLEAAKEALRRLRSEIASVHASKFDGSELRLFMLLIDEFLATLEGETFPARSIRREINSMMEILQRLAGGDKIVFSQDGDDAWFAGGDRAFVGNVITEMRSKGYLKRGCDDEENYRGSGEYDTISEHGRVALATLEGET